MRENVINAVRLDGVKHVDADHESATVEIGVEDIVTDDVLTTATHDAGYEVVA